MNPFDCTCTHPVTAHKEKQWPHFAPRCTKCNCPAYQPNYKAGK